MADPTVGIALISTVGGITAASITAVFAWLSSRRRTRDNDDEWRDLVTRLAECEAREAVRDRTRRQRHPAPRTAQPSGPEGPPDD